MELIELDRLFFSCEFPSTHLSIKVMNVCLGDASGFWKGVFFALKVIEFCSSVLFYGHEYTHTIKEIDTSNSDIDAMRMR